MSRTHKDGVRGGGHRNTQRREVWSRRCRAVAMWARDSFGWKRITHRFERREARQETRDALRSTISPPGEP